MLELDKIFEHIKSEVVLDINLDIESQIKLTSNIDILRKMLDEVDEAVILSERMGTFPLYFHVDLTPSFIKTQKQGVLSVEEVVEIGKFLDSIRDIYLYVEKLEKAGIASPFFNTYLEQITYVKELNVKIKSIVTEFGEIKDDASTILKDLRRKQRDYEKHIQQKLQEIIQKNASKLTQAIVSIRNNRYVIPVRNDSKNAIKGIVHDQSASGETLFIEPTIICEMNNALNQAREAEQREIYQILRNISLMIGLHVNVLITSYDCLKYLDIVFAKARYAIKIDAHKPNINDEGIVDLIQCRHPLLNVKHVISNNVRIGGDYQGIIITGPNTGGKTVLLKTVGLLALMVKAGLLIPSDAKSNMMIFDDVYADIGDEQSIDQNLSTFSSHLKNVIEMLKKVTRDSLVLLDELGSGTDPLEGSSLAISVFEHLIERNCLIIATSHYSELKIYAYDSQKVINASVEFNPKTLQPTYKLLMGIPGMSNALNIAQTLGLDPSIIEHAQNYVYKRNDNLNHVLDKLIKQSHELDEKLKLVEKEKQLLNETLKSADLEKMRIVQSEEKIIARANEQAKLLIDKSMKDINELLIELKSMKNRSIKPHELADITHKARSLEDNLISESILPSEAPIRINDTVYVKTYDCYGTILKELNNDYYEVQIGNASIKLQKSYLTPSQSDTQVKPTIIRTPTKHTTKQSISATLDLRGQRYEDASEKIDKFIDDAIYANLHMITFIHGFGTGVIRKLVQDTLISHSFIESFRYGGANEGGQGVTVAILKNR